MIGARYYTYFDSPHGKLLLVASDHALCGVHFVGEKYYPRVDAGWREDANAAPLRAAALQLSEYFAGTRRNFALPLAAEGSEFQRRVWQALTSIAFGATASYANIARRLGNPNATRAVGAANGRNPISIIVPCHRVIGADGSLTGYAGGIARKQALLDFEARQTAELELH